MKEEFDLSENRCRSLILAETIGIEEEWWYPEKKVKEAVRRLKEKGNKLIKLYIENVQRLGKDNLESDFDKGASVGVREMLDKIDKNFGDKLI